MVGNTDERAMIHESAYYSTFTKSDFFIDEDKKTLVPLYWALGFDLFETWLVTDSMFATFDFVLNTEEVRYKSAIKNKDKAVFLLRGEDLVNTFKDNITHAMLDVFCKGLENLGPRLRYFLSKINLVVPKDAVMFYNQNTIDVMLRDIVSSAILTSYLPPYKIRSISGRSKLSALRAIHILEGKATGDLWYTGTHSVGLDGFVKTNMTGYSVSNSRCEIVLPYLEGVSMRLNIIMDMLFKQTSWHSWHAYNETAVRVHKESIASIGMDMIKDPRFGVEVVKEPSLVDREYRGTSAKMVTKIMDDFVRKHNLPVRLSTLKELNVFKIKPERINAIECLSL